MQIRTRMSTSADGYVTTPGGWPALTADPAFVSGRSHGIREFLAGCEAAFMGRTTFESERALPGGSVEIVYSVTGNAGGSPAREAGWSPASQRPK
jgi:hypothetical protein